jgi:hypothetical protein
MVFKVSLLLTPGGSARHVPGNFPQRAPGLLK